MNGPSCAARGFRSELITNLSRFREIAIIDLPRTPRRRDSTTS